MNKLAKILSGLFCICMIMALLVTCMNEDDYHPIEVTQLSDTIWLMNENDKATGYIVVGSDKAAVIDTMNGYEDIQKVVRTVTNLPLIVINTHGHLDHVNGNAYFDEVYIHPDDVYLAEASYRNSQYSNIGDATLKTTEEGDSFKLGGITLEIYDLPGHTPGGICLLDREDRVLFTGDSINRHCWMQLDSCTSMEDFYLALQRLDFIRDDYDYILHGHAQEFEDASLYEEQMAALKEVIDGKNTAMDEDYSYYGGLCKIHKSSENVSIVYNP